MSAAVEFGLHPKQGQCFLSEATEILYGGAAGGGKSHLMRIAAISWAYSVPGLQVYIFRRLSDDLEKNHLHGPTAFPVLLQEWIDRKLVRINWQKKQIHFWNGAAIHLCHCQYEKDKYKYQGAEIHVLMIDELTHFSDDIYRYLRGRCRVSEALVIPEDLGVKFPRILCGSNPGGIGHNFVKATFIKGAKPMAIRQMEPDEGGFTRQFIPALLRDNPSLDEAQYAATLAGLGNPALVKAMRDGDWNIVSGGMIDDLWLEGRHVLERFEIPHSWRINRSFDWGSSAPFSVGWWAECSGEDAILHDGNTRSFPRGTKIRIAEWYGTNGRPNKGLKMLATEIAEGIKTREQTLNIANRVKPGPADTSIFDTQNGVCIADDMASKGVRWERADKRAGSRKNGAEKIRQLLKAAAQDVPEDPGMFVFETCRFFIDLMPVIPRSERDQDDVDTDAEDHIWDETRYQVQEPKRDLKRIQLRNH